jgi:DNA-binding transcriptional LysR family regulator
MSKAAALLNTTQSAISRSVADLEQTIGVRLLDRGPRGASCRHRMVAPCSSTVL